MSTMLAVFRQKSVGTIINWGDSEYFIRDDDAVIYIRCNGLEKFLKEIYVEGKKVKVEIKVTEI